MHGFVQKVRRTIRRHQLIRPAERLLVATSGGPDSVALTRALLALGYRPDLLYVDHGTRPETAEEAAFVTALASEHGLGVQVRECAPSGASEAALREARYAQFEHARRAISADRVALGHTSSDQAETVLIRLLRGTGPWGLSGIPVARDAYVRPLLEHDRSQVIGYLEDLGQTWCVDGSNASTDPFRNRIRLELLPLLRERYQSKVDTLLCGLARSAASDRAYLADQVERFFAEHGMDPGMGPGMDPGQEGALTVAALRAAHPGLRPHILRALAPVPIDGERMAAVLEQVARGPGVIQLEGAFEVEITPRGNRSSGLIRVRPKENDGPNDNHGGVSATGGRATKPTGST